MEKKSARAAKSLPTINGIAVHCAHVSIVDIGKLKPYPRNNKIHTDTQLNMLCKAIKAQGWRAPITVSNQSGYIVRGHARLEAAKRLGLKQAPVDYQDYADEKAERADRIADNKMADLAEWDLPNLKDELLELDTGVLDMEITGFDANAMEDLMTQFHVGGVDKYSDLDKENDGLAGNEDVTIPVTVPAKHLKKITEWLANGELKTGPGMGRGVMKRCKLL